MSVNLIKTCDLIEESLELLQSEKYKELLDSLIELKDNIEKCKQNISTLENIAPKYDFDEKTPGNGIRSFIETFEFGLNKINKQLSQLNNLPSNSIKSKARLVPKFSI